MLYVSLTLISQNLVLTSIFRIVLREVKTAFLLSDFYLVFLEEQPNSGVKRNITSISEKFLQKLGSLSTDYV